MTSCLLHLLYISIFVAFYDGIRGDIKNVNPTLPFGINGREFYGNEHF